jgi:photosystem II stability/assembly factor-like uncharacterized protein
MAKHFSICVGTLGMGLWQSQDGGKSWARGKLWKGYQGGRSVFGMAVHPREPNVIYAGSDEGLYRSEDRGINFEHIAGPLDEFKVWRVAIDPVDPDTMFAGTAPAKVFRSRDGGQRWEELDVPFSEDCFNVNVPRVLAIAIDPSDHRIVWAGVEVGGACRSLDGGDTWTRLSNGPLEELDVHDIKVIPGKTGGAIVTLPSEIYETEDKGESWHELGVHSQFPLPYCRSLVFKQDNPQVILAAIGDNALGEAGTIQRSTDGGATWETPFLPVNPNTHMECFATHPADPNLILGCSHYGQLFGSSDGGEWWIKFPREFTEIRGALAWTPN